MADASASLEEFWIVIHKICRILYPSIDLNMDLSSTALGNPRIGILRRVITDSDTILVFLAR